MRRASQGVVEGGATHWAIAEYGIALPLDEAGGIESVAALALDAVVEVVGQPLPLEHRQRFILPLPPCLLHPLSAHHLAARQAG